LRAAWGIVYQNFRELHVEQIQIPVSLSAREAGVWFSFFDLFQDQFLFRQFEDYERLFRKAEADPIPSIEEWIKQMAQKLAQEGNSPIYWYLLHHPQLFLPFLSGIEIAGLILLVGTKGRNLNVYNKAVMACSFAIKIFPYMGSEERQLLRADFERLYQPQSPNSDVSVLSVAMLSLYENHPIVSQWARVCSDQTMQYHPSLWLRIVAGLGRKHFISQAKRIVPHLRSGEDARTWLAATELEDLAFIRSSVKAALAKEAVGIATVFSLVEAPEAALPMLEIRNSDRCQLVAAVWFMKYPITVALGLIPIAMGSGALQFRAREQLRETVVQLGGRAEEIELYLTPETAVWFKREFLQTTSPKPISEEEFPKALRKELDKVKGTPLFPKWLAITSLPPILIHGKEMELGDVRNVLAALKKTGLGKKSSLLDQLKNFADARTLDQFACGVFERWHQAGEPNEDRWALAAIGHLGGDHSVHHLTPIIRLWPRDQKQQRAVLGLRCLKEIGSDTAISAINGIAERVKYRALQYRAQDSLHDTNSQLGMV
jgi:hypothetical protein